MALLELELRRLDRKYAGLRVLSIDRLGPLLLSLSEVGQQTPVLVVATSANSAVLIDGYRRATALDRLGRDTITALVVDLSEAEALLMRHQLAASQDCTALEDGWLLRELHDSHQVAQSDLAVRMNRSVSWVSRRLGLVRDLPESVQDLVREGWVPAFAAMKYLLSLARANKTACERLAQKLKGQRWSARQVAEIYLGWRKAGPEERQRIVEDPGFFCHLHSAVKAPPPPDVASGDAKLAQELNKLKGMCMRLQRLLGPQMRAQGRLDADDVFMTLWHDAERAFEALKASIEEDLRRA